MFLEDGTILALALSIFGKLLCGLFAAEDDALEQEDMILPVNIGLGHHKDVVEE